MTQEINSIYQADGVGVSPLYGQYGKEGEVKTDYTQFTPRSHYAKTSLLRAYFRAMMYLGRNSYLLSSPEAISDALLLAHLMASPGPDGQPLVKDWQKLMEITAFYAGAPDDIGYPEWRNFVVKVLGTEKFSPAEAVNPEVLTKISQQLAELRAAQDFVRRHHQRGRAAADQGRTVSQHQGLSDIRPALHVRRLGLRPTDRRAGEGGGAPAFHPHGPVRPGGVGR